MVRIELYRNLREKRVGVLSYFADSSASFAVKSLYRKVRKGSAKVAKNVASELAVEEEFAIAFAA
jgi:hypothetical protein